ncbi:hypothetical protein C4K23_2131 [Pseudomonas chlororaphis]|nr:hypothetical protein C4K23_2131 [Pseudomonas chlororaphis]
MNREQRICGSRRRGHLQRLCSSGTAHLKGAGLVFNYRDECL